MIATSCDAVNSEHTLTNEAVKTLKEGEEQKKPPVIFFTAVPRKGRQKLASHVFFIQGTGIL